MALPITLVVGVVVFYFIPIQNHCHLDSDRVITKSDLQIGGKSKGVWNCFDWICWRLTLTPFSDSGAAGQTTKG